MIKFLKYLNSFYYLFPITIIILSLILIDTKASTDTQRFIRWASDMSLNPFSAINYLFQERGVDGVMFYFSVLYYKISLILDNYFKLLFIFFNFLSFIFTLILIKKFSFKIKYYYLIPILISINYDYIIWSNYLLTDFFFSFLCLAFVVNLSLKNNNYINFLLIVLLIFTRPPGIVSVFIYLQYLFLINVTEDKNLLKKKFFILITIYFIISIFTAYLLINNIFPDTFYDTFQYHRSYYLEGVIINDRPHTYVEEPKNLIDMIKIIFLRFINFFKFYDELYSFKHNILNTFIFITLFSLSLFTLFKFNSYQIEQKKIIITMVITIVSFCFFHSILIIDYDWRYRIPCIIPISILAIMGLEKFSFSNKENN